MAAYCKITETVDYFVEWTNEYTEISAKKKIVSPDALAHFLPPDNEWYITHCASLSETFKKKKTWN